MSKASNVADKIISTIDMDTARLSASDYRSVLEELIDHLEAKLDCAPDDENEDEDHP